MSAVTDARDALDTARERLADALANPLVAQLAEEELGVHMTPDEVRSLLTLARSLEAAHAAAVSANNGPVTA